MEGWITLSRLQKLTKFLDYFCGNIEPIHRNIYFFYENGLKIYATDGCSKVIINFSREFLPFSGTAIVPIRYLKGLLRGTPKQSDDIIKIVINKDKMDFELENMTMNIDINRKEQNIELEKTFKVLSEGPLKEFIKALDFVSISANEGDNISIFSRNNNLYFSYSCSYYQLISSSFKTKSNFSFQIPYATARHLVKALSNFKEVNMNLGIKNNNLVFYIPGMFLNVCYQKIEKPYNGLIKEHYLEKISIETEEIKKALNKLYVAFSNNIAFLILSPQTSFIYKDENNSKISWKLPISTKNQYLISIHIKKMRSILTRMNKKTTLYLGKNEIVFINKDFKSRFKVLEFKKL